VIGSDASAEGDVIHADSHCLATLLLVRGIQAGRRRAKSSAGASSAHLERLSSSLLDGGGGDGFKTPLPRVRSRSSLAAATVGEGSAHGGAPGAGVASRFAGDVLSSAARLPIVVEILDPRTQRTVAESASMGLVSDFIQSNDLVSKILAMVAEDPHSKVVLDQLLGGTGTQFAVVPSEEYVAPLALVSFAELARHCSAQRGATLCGYIAPSARGRARRVGACVMNPADKGARRAWGGHGLVLIATDARLVARDATERGLLCDDLVGATP
jgi:hypothetical protein